MKRKLSYNTTDSVARFLALATSCVLVCGCYHEPGDHYAPDEATAKLVRTELAENMNAPGATAAQVEKRTGWATLKGTILVDGKAPAPPVLNIDKDPQVCMPGGHPVLSQSIVTGPDGGLANFTIWAAGVDPSNVHESAAGGKGKLEPLDQEHCVFLTHVFPMRAGQKLVIKNSDTVSHNTLIRFQNNPPLNQTIGPNQSMEYTPAKPEAKPVNVECSIHPWMRAYLMPHDNGYVVVTGKDGKFEIPNLPAGVNLKIQLWHETFNINNLNEVTINGKQVPVRRGVLSLKLEPDKTASLEAKIPGAALQ